MAESTAGSIIQCRAEDASVADLYRWLKTYEQSDIYPYHMPGHKRNMGHMPLSEAYEIDVTEIDGTDNLYHADGILQEAMQRAAKLYGADETHFLVNGSTGGILSAVAAAVKPGGHILMARNSHRSAYNAAMLQNLRTTYLYPEYIDGFQIMGGITPDAVRNALAEHDDVEAVFITSPTYEGIVSDIRGIAQIVHEHHIPLIVDEAHGAHFGLYEKLPASAVTEGADIVIQSLHKTLPAFTQTALLHINGELADRERVRRYLSVYQTSSPSYVFMAGIDECIHLLETERNELFTQFYYKRQQFIEKTAHLKYIRVLEKSIVGKCGITALDDCKLVISVAGTDCSGQQLYHILLHEYGLQMEMAESTYVLAIITIMDTEEGFRRLAEALNAIDAGLQPMVEIMDAGQRAMLEAAMAEKAESFTAASSADDNQSSKCHHGSCAKQTGISAKLTIGEALSLTNEDCLLTECENRIAADYICVYPPGIPLIVPGEYFTEQKIRQIEKYLADGLCVLGITKNENTVKVIKLT